MLVLSRTEDESIIIDANGTKIEVRIVKIGPNNIRVGINAPREIIVHRKEVFDIIESSNKEALSKAPRKNALSSAAAKLRKQDKEPAGIES